MSEKRFELAEDSNGLYSIFDNEDKENEPLIYGARFGTEEIVDLLNEQQSIIDKQNELLNEISTIFERYGVETGYNKRILEVALQNLKNGDY